LPAPTRSINWGNYRITEKNRTGKPIKQLKKQAYIMFFEYIH
jgi:hypothetical protein